MMQPLKFIPEYKEYLDAKVLHLPDVKEGKMFGYPAYYVNGKLAICHYEDNLIIKLPADVVTELVEKDKNASREGPKPRRNTGKEWVFLHVPSIDVLRNYEALCNTSITFCSQKST